MPVAPPDSNQPDPSNKGKAPGKVYLVGAGPGDPGLFTIRGQEILRHADVVLYDYLVNPQLLENVSPSARTICLGRHGREPILCQEDVNRILLEEAQRGYQVVRLKGGDPAVFARFAEETEPLLQAGIPLEIVPGITTALAVGSHAGIALTHASQASAVALVAGQEKLDKTESSLDYRQLASFPGTLVFYMGVTSAGRWSQALIQGGKDPATPAAVIRRCSWPDQQIFRCTLGTLEQEILARKLRPPAVVIVGQVTASSTGCDWFIRRPLFGRRILVTRAAEQNHSLRNLLQEHGADVWVQPAIEIKPATDLASLDKVLDRLDGFDWIVFSSANGVRFFLDRLLINGKDARQLGRARLAAIGPGTQDALREYHLLADLVPQEFRAESLVDSLLANQPGRRYLLIRASRGREVLAEQLVAAGKEVEQIVVYQSTDVTQPNEDVLQALTQGEIAWVTVTSSAIARSLVRLFGEKLRQTKLVSISPVTTATLTELGYPPAAEASPYTMPGIVQAILAYESRK